MLSGIEGEGPGELIQEISGIDLDSSDCCGSQHGSYTVLADNDSGCQGTAFFPGVGCIGAGSGGEPKSDDNVLRISWGISCNVSQETVTMLIQISENLEGLQHLLFSGVAIDIVNQTPFNCSRFGVEDELHFFDQSGGDWCDWSGATINVIPIQT